MAATSSRSHSFLAHMMVRARRRMVVSVCNAKDIASTRVAVKNHVSAGFLAALVKARALIAQDVFASIIVENAILGSVNLAAWWPYSIRATSIMMTFEKDDARIIVCNLGYRQGP